MIELVMWVCMIDQPWRCKEAKLNFDEMNVTQRQCMMNGQFAMAPWAGENPNWVIKNWHCGIAGQSAKL